MGMEIREEALTALEEHSRISIAFKVDRVFDIAIRDRGLGGIELTERRLDTSYVKDYDSVEGDHPLHWEQRFDLSNWGLLSAWSGGVHVGGAAIAFRTKGLCMLDDREDLAVLWDLRVSPEHRGQGVGAVLFAAAEDWARARGCRQLKVETQNVNVGACRFYAGRGCVLGGIHRFAYPGLPEEIQLLWYKDLTSGTHPAAESRGDDGT